MTSETARNKAARGRRREEEKTDKKKIERKWWFYFGDIYTAIKKIIFDFFVFFFLSIWCGWMSELSGGSFFPFIFAFFIVITLHFFFGFALFFLLFSLSTLHLSSLCEIHEFGFFLFFHFFSYFSFNFSINSHQFKTRNGFGCFVGLSCTYT